MKKLIPVLIFALSPMLVHADAFDDKARTEAAQQQQAQESKAHAQKYQQIVRGNSAIIRRIPRGATITKCFDLYASWYRNETNGCWLAEMDWNGVPVQVCSETYDKTLPPNIVQCHYHVQRTGQDCEIFANASLKPRCL